MPKKNCNKILRKEEESVSSEIGLAVGIWGAAEEIVEKNDLALNRQSRNLLCGETLALMRSYRFNHLLIPAASYPTTM